MAARPAAASGPAARRTASPGAEERGSARPPEALTATPQPQNGKSTGHSDPGETGNSRRQTQGTTGAKQSENTNEYIANSEGHVRTGRSGAPGAATATAHTRGPWLLLGSLLLVTISAHPWRTWASRPATHHEPSGRATKSLAPPPVNAGRTAGRENRAVEDTSK